MKNLSILFTIIAMSTTLGVAGCKKKQDDAAKTDTTTTAKPAEGTSTTTPTPDPAKPADGTTPATGTTADPAKPADGTTPATGTTAAAGDLPAECAEYKTVMEKLATCEKLTPEAKTTLKTSFDEQSKSWQNMSGMAEDSKKAIIASCKQAVEAAKTTAGAQCGL